MLDRFTLLISVMVSVIYTQIRIDQIVDSVCGAFYVSYTSIIIKV